MSRNNAELSNIIPFKEDDHWYLELVYKYEDKKVSIDDIFMQ